MCNKDNWKEGHIEENPIWSKVSKLQKLTPFSIVDLVKNIFEVCSNF